MRRLFLLCGLVPLTAVASEHWIRFTSGPIEVFSSAGSKDGRDTLVKFEEFRHALGQVLGDNDLQLPLPIRVLLFKTGAPQIPEPVIRGRDQYNIVLTAGQAIRNEVFSHGWPLSSDSWESQMLFLATNGYRCIAHDRRG